ncbi:MAG: antitoxin [Acidobacteria bacterium]|nr:antitoxin [Acidobacteriota bacterium]
MRTTVTLDSDVERLLKSAVRESGTSFKKVLNDAIREGLRGPAGPRRRKFKQKTVSLGSEQYFRWEQALGTAAAMEDEELVRKMSVGK